MKQKFRGMIWRRGRQKKKRKKRNMKPRRPKECHGLGEKGKEPLEQERIRVLGQR